MSKPMEVYMKKPYNAGDFVMYGSRPVMIVGHIWWPIEKTNAYHVLYVEQNGEPKEPEKVEYVWDHGDNFKKWQPNA